MRPRTLRTAIAVVTAGITLTACGSDDGGGDGGGGGDGSDAATATSAEDFGGMDALVEAAQEEGTLNVIALPPDWANYGAMLDAFSEKYDIEINSATPDGSSQDELNAVTSQRGQDRAPDVLDLGTAFARQAQAQDLLAPYQVATWDEIPEGQKDPEGHWYNDYGGYISIGCNATVIAECPTSFEALLDPQYAGQVALNGNPTQAAAAFAGVWAASLANGGDLDDIGPGIDFFVDVKEAGNFNPVEITPATIQSGETPLAIDWDYLNAGLTDTLSEQGVEWEVAVPSDGLFGGYYSQAISAFAPHPAAARLWQEFLYSDEGQNIWLAGGARPVRLRDGGGRYRRRGGPLGPPAGRGHGRVPDAGAGDRRAAGHGGALERRDLRLSTPAGDPAAPAPRGRGRRGAVLTALGALPFFLYVAVFLLLPIGVLAVEAFRATDPVTFEESWSIDSIVAVTDGAYRRAYLGSLQLSAITAVLGAIFGLALAIAVLRTRRNSLLRRLILTASGVLANFGGIPLAFAFLATIGTAGVVTTLLQDSLGLGLGGFSLYSMTGLALVYLYFLVPLMVLTITPALEALRPQWREAADNLGATGWQYWRHVGGPVLAPPVIGATMLLFASAFAAYATAKALVGSSVPLVTLQIADALSSNVVVGSENLGKALALGMVVLIGAVMAFYAWVQRRTQRWLA